MYENSENWISARVKGAIKNNSICILNDDMTLSNIKNRDEIGSRTFVYVDVEIFDINRQSVVPEFIEHNQWARCLRVHILAT